MSTMIICVESWEEFKARSTGRWQAYTRGEFKQDESVISYPCVERLLEDFSPKRIAMLKQLSSTEGLTHQQLAEKLSRPVRATLRDLNYLVKLGAVEAESEETPQGEVTYFYNFADRYVIVCEIAESLNTELPSNLSLAETRSAA